MNQPPAVKRNDLEDAMTLVSSGADFDNAAWLRRETGEVLWDADDDGDWEPVPEDVDEGDRYVAIPDKHELGLGKPLAMAFARVQLPDCVERVYDIFSHRGAYGRFKDLLDRRDSLDAWYQFEQDKTREALREWCADNGIAVAD